MLGCHNSSMLFLCVIKVSVCIYLNNTVLLITQLSLTSEAAARHPEG